MVKSHDTSHFSATVALAQRPGGRGPPHRCSCRALKAWKSSPGEQLELQV